MPDSLDVDQIARQFVTTWVRGWMPDAQIAVLTTRLAEEFRQIWSGAVDLAKVEHELSTLTGSTATGPFVKDLDRALRTLDKYTTTRTSIPDDFVPLEAWMSPY